MQEGFYRGEYGGVLLEYYPIEGANTESEP